MDKSQSKSRPPTALWCPAWYELDQTLVVGQRGKMWFFKRLPEWAQASLDSQCNQPMIDCVFYNQLYSAEDCWQQEATIVEIFHPQLGLISKIDTHGLDYIFFPVDGEEIVVDAEETPGIVVHGNDLTSQIEDWSVYVRLTDSDFPSFPETETSVAETESSA